VLDFHDLSHCLGPEQPIYGLRYGMGDAVAGRALCLPAIEELASHYIDEMQRFQPEGPYFLIGHSFGGIVAYEMAQQLTAKGEELGLLALLDSYISGWGIMRRATPREVLSNIDRMGGAEFLRRVQRKLAMLSANSRKRRRKIQKNRLASYAPHLYHVQPAIDLAQAYQPKPLERKIVLFKSVCPSILHIVEPPEVGWRKYALGGLEVQDVPGGDHRTILWQPHVSVLAEKLRKVMDEALEHLGKAE
jgi:thioesterase domain-containing protein